MIGRMIDHHRVGRDRPADVREVDRQAREPRFVWPMYSPIGMRDDRRDAGPRARRSGGARTSRFGMPVVPVQWAGSRKKATMSSISAAPARARAHGVTTRSTRTSRKSAANARSDRQDRAEVGLGREERLEPSVMNWPSPPNVSPRTAATVARPIVVTLASRMPAMISGTASGSSTRSSRCRRV